MKGHSQQGWHTLQSDQKDLVVVTKVFIGSEDPKGNKLITELPRTSETFSFH